MNPDPPLAETAKVPAGQPAAVLPTDHTVSLPNAGGGLPAAAAGVVPGFTIERVLGRGGMGVVYLARQSSPGRPVALKMVLAGAHAGPAALDRFRLEGEAIARLGHPGIVRVYAVGEAGGLPFMALEYVDGPTLETAPPPATPRAAAELVRQVAEAVGHAHQRGIVHRDLKPGNVLIGPDGRPKVTDFGLAKFDPALAPSLDDVAATTRSGAILGSPRYMAPEQAAGRVREVGPATDVHALGVILYALLAGRPAFDGESLLHVLDRVRTVDPVPVRAVNPAVPRDLAVIVGKCLEKQPAKRYPTAGELAADLGRFLAGEPIAARPTPPWERAAKWARRHPDAAVVRGIIAFLAPPSAFAVLAAAPALGLACSTNAALGAAAALSVGWRGRGAVLAAAAATVAIEWAVHPAVVEIAARYFPLGVACGLTGRLAGRRWGRPPLTVAAVALGCGACGVLVVAVPAMRLGVWGLPPSLVAASVCFLLAGVGGGISFARASSTGPAQSRRGPPLGAVEADQPTHVQAQPGAAAVGGGM